MEGQTLNDANRQWATRPDDERYASLEELHARVKREAEVSTELEPFPRRRLQIAATSAGDLLAELPEGPRAGFTNWSFHQLAGLCRTPGNFVAELPAPLAADVLNHRLRTVPEPKEQAACLTISEPGKPTRLRSVNSEKYARVWSAFLVEGCLRAQSRGWIVPPAYGGKPAGVYHGDRDTWIFMVDSPEASYLLRDTKSARTEQLYRGFFAWNSEVGARRIGFKTFLHNGTCGNHYVWGAQGVVEVSMRHVGDVMRRLPQAFRAALGAASRSLDDELAGIRMAMDEELGKDEAAAVAMAVKRTELPAKTIRAAYMTGEAEGSDPRYSWGMVQGITALARKSPYGDERMALEAAAVSLLPVPRGGGFKPVAV